MKIETYTCDLCDELIETDPDTDDKVSYTFSSASFTGSMKGRKAPQQLDFHGRCLLDKIGEWRAL